ncbi:MAG: hypothetical protein JWN25_980 [Verrucomicrobiales bacterium]|nr:hypothetical protein [Verrucomicrobiales bacterium]
MLYGFKLGVSSYMLVTETIKSQQKTKPSSGYRKDASIQAAPRWI